MKPGYKTTEFWLTVAVVVAGLLAGSGAIKEGSPMSEWIGFATALLAKLGYSFNRTSVKKAAPAKAVSDGEG